MAGRVWMWVVTLCVFIKILHFSTAQTNQTECAVGRYGPNCTETCGSCANLHDCNKVTGSCPSCKTGFSGTQCKECSPLRWGTSCSSCGTGCAGACHASNGACTCRDGWTGLRCTECAVGRYGPNCTETCGSCANLRDCNNMTGSCPSCTTGFNGTLCKDCAVGNWGDTCSHLCGSGCEDGVCDALHGICDCKKGWKIPTCEDCTEGHYNKSNDCQNTCGEGCNNTCRKTDGTCQCRPGWQPPLCQWCADGWFGSECTECGHCANNSVCDKKTGVCPFCDGDFVAPLCVDAVAPCKDSCSMAGPVAGTAIGCSVVFFIVGAIFDWWMRRSRSKQPSQADYSHEEFSSKSNLDTPALSSRRLAECPGRPESPKDRSEDTSDYGNIGFDSNIYEESVVSDNKMTAYVPLEFPVNSENTDNDSDNDYINADVTSQTAARVKPTKF